MDATARQLIAQLQQNPLDVGVLDALRQHCEATRSHSVWADALAQHTRALGEADGDPIELGRLHNELGKLYREQLGSPELALEHYRAAFDFDAAQRPAIVAARAIVTELGDYAQAADLLAREAESLPAGEKRAAAWLELATVYKERLDDGEQAVLALREAVAADPRDLHMQHQLATLLLELADAESDVESADHQRRDAADVLGRMATAVSDDYAFAYIEAALDAVPDHEPSLALLEQVAPRLNRGDALAPRWLAAIRATRNRMLARALRLNMARAYVAVGQLSDARICLEPLLAERDAEALEIASAFDPSASATREPLDDESVEETLSSSELLLDEAESDGGLAAQLAELEGEPHGDASDPLADLAVIDKRGSTPSFDDDDRELLDSSERTASEAAPEVDEQLRAAAQGPDSSELALANLGPYEPKAEDPTPVYNEGARRSQPPAGASAAPSAPPLGREPLKLPFDDDDVDPFSEQTQPRAEPLTLAELTALTGGTQPRATGLPMEEDSEGDKHGEVTQITPAEDPQMTEVRSLRTELARRLRLRDRRGAAEVSETLLERGVFDPEAIEALEDHYRIARDFRKLRDLSLRIAREPSFAADVRAARLREAVMLSESKLGDHEGAASALRELLQLAPGDAEAFDKYRRILTRAQRWEELATLLSERANGEREPRLQADLLRQLGLIEREQRQAPDRAIEALARARALDPLPEDDIALSELYLAAGRFAEGADALEARIAHAPAEEQSGLLANLARVYEERLHDDARALHAVERRRALDPRKLDAIDAQIRLLERRGDGPALLSALGDRLALAAPSERGKLHVRIAELALNTLGDADRAADSYAEAIALDPQANTLWSAAESAFERAGRGNELDALLSNLAQTGRDRALQGKLWGHLAEARARREDLAGAIAAREAQLGVSSEVSVLEALVALLRRTDRANDLARRLDDLARRSEPDVARALRIERAHVLAEKLRDPEGAKAELERVLTELAPDDANALRLLIDLCLATGDNARRASAQERLIKLAPSLAARVELATELVDLYERELGDTAGAVRVLSLWTALEPQNPQPYLRLVPLLTASGRRRELVEANDKLAALAMTDEEAGEFVLRAARVAIELQDHDGAWNRLVPRVVERNDLAAETLLRELATTASRGEQLAALYVGLAQRAEDPQRERQRWADAARAFEQQVGAPDRALEAMLRALAKQLDSEEMLREVERLAQRARAWPRLAQVYDTLIRKAPNTRARIELLMRHGKLLEQRAEDASAAFERVWLAFQLDPSRDDTFEEARRLAQATDRHEELLSIYEKRAQSGASLDARLEALLAACALAMHGFEDPARATGYLARAVSLAADDLVRLDDIEGRVRGIDREQPSIHGRGLIAELAGVYATLAGEHSKRPELAAAWLARAARIHEHTLEDASAAFRMLERASALTPGDEQLLDELHRVASLGNKWEALAAHLQHTADVAIDSKSSSAALSRLGALYEHELASPTRAADAYEQLVRLRPQDAEASRRLRHCLRAAERFEELLIAIDRELFMLKPEDGKRELLKQAAETWELGLKNRYEALDAWRKVIAVAPNDADAIAALARLRSRPRADDSLLDGDLIVRPEDLRPSLTGTPVDESLFTTLGRSERRPAASFLGEATSDASIEPEQVSREELSLLSGELALDNGQANPDETTKRADRSALRVAEEQAHAAPELGAEASTERAVERANAARDEGDGAVALASLEDDFDEDGDIEQLDDLDHEELFDPDVTLPLERRQEEPVSLEGLSSLVERPADGRPRTPPPPRPRKSEPSGRS